MSTERYLTSTSSSSELEFTKKHIASLSGQKVAYPADFTCEPSERERKVPLVAIPVVKPPETLSSQAASTSTSTSASTSTSTSGSSITLTVKSLKPALSFTLPCPLTSSISQLKADLYATSKYRGAPEPSAQRWLFKGKAMQDERLLKEYEGVKDGDTVHLSIKAGAAAAASPAPAPSVAATGAAASASTPTAAISPMPSPLPAAAGEAKTAPSPFGFKSQSMSSGPLSPTKHTSSSSISSLNDARRNRTSSTASLSAGNASNGGRHARVPSITLTTDFTNFDNLAGNASGTSPIDESLNPAVPLEGSSAALPAGSPPFRPASPRSPAGSGASTPRSAPGTPATGNGGRSRGPSISIPIDLDSVELMNPLSSDRKTPVGLSPSFISTIKDPRTWNEILEFLDAKFDKNDPLALATAQLNGGSTGSPADSGATSPGTVVPKEKGEYREETKRVFETWLGASKDYMNASDIARIRDSTGVWGMGGR